MDQEQKLFLRRRLRDASKSQPELKKLKPLLLRFGGDYLVAPPKPDPDLLRLLQWGIVTGGRIVLKPMKRSSCHENVSVLWRKRRFGTVGIATGYALSEDGLWRQHTWGLLRDGILETTATRLVYFGIILQEEKADLFVESNLR
jgi:hypothetical protein